jgi:hypothetical protein
MSLSNPYVIDRPLMQGEVFVGRYKPLAEVARRIRSGERLVLVYGSDRIGKTSFLRQLEQELAEGFLTVYIDFTWPLDGDVLAEPGVDVAQRSIEQLRAKILRALEPGLGQPGIPADDSRSREWDASTVLDVLNDRMLLLLVDGLDLGNLGSEAGSSFLVYLQDWMHSAPNLQLVVSVNGTLQGTSMFAPAWASVPSVELQGLALDDTEDLLLRPARGRVAYDFAAIRRIWDLTSGHPYLVQLFGYLLFNIRTIGGRIRVPDVENIIPQCVTGLRPTMDRIWSRASRNGRALLALSNELKGRHGVLTVRDLHDVARQQALTISEAEIEEGLKEWLAQGVLQQLSSDSYSFYSDLYRLWVAKYKPVADTLVELKFRKHLAVSSTSRPPRAGYRWGTLGLQLAGLLLVAAVVVLWNMRGSAQRVTVGALSTATPVPFATRATLVIGPALGHIAYMSKDNPDATWDIWVMRGDGSDPQRLTDDPADDMSPAWSANGKMIAFVTDRDGDREIYVMKADGTQEINLTHHPAEDWAPAWSPDGTSIAFSSYRDGNWEIYVMGSDGSDPRRLTFDSAADYGPCWAPDGQSVAFHSNRDGNWEIYVVGLDGQTLLRLTEDEATDFAPAWSPDGKRIAFESYRDGNMEIYLMNVDGSEQRNVSEDPYSNEHGPSWARSGTKLAFFSNRDGGWDVFLMNPDGTEKANLTLSPALEQNPDWHE